MEHNRLFEVVHPYKKEPLNLGRFKGSINLFWCLETELNRRHMDFQSIALPTELPRLRGLE